MKKSLVILVALIAAIAIAAPSFAGVEFKYGGLYRVRLQSDDNIQDGDDDIDDNGNWIDQRLRMSFRFIASERLQLVTQWEADTLWGFESAGAGRHGGGDVGADATNLEMKNIYIDFLIPQTEVRARVGVQPIALLKGWVLNDDFSAAVLSTKFDPISILFAYVAGANTDVTSTQDNIDDYILQLSYANGPFSAALVGLYQAAGDDISASTFLDPTHNNDTMILGNLAGQALTGTASAAAYRALLDANADLADNDLFDVGLSLGYKTDLMSAYVNFVKNFGSVEINGDSADYTGWMAEAGVDFFIQNFTLTLGGFYTTGQDLNDDFDDIDFFVYPRGASHYWSEIMGLGTLDVNVGGFDRVRYNAGYTPYDIPSNLWTVTLGAAWQALPTTKLTLNYYYIATAEDVISSVAPDGTFSYDDTIGHEVDFYLDQAVVDGLNLRLVAAYLFADDGFTINEDDDDAYELGAQLMWSF